MKDVINILCFSVGLLFVCLFIPSFAHAEECAEFVPDCDKVDYVYGNTCRTYNAGVPTDVVKVAYYSVTGGSGCSTTIDGPRTYTDNNMLYIYTPDGTATFCSDEQTSYRFWTFTMSTAITCPDPVPTEPATCQDGVVSGDETGFDCGGSCLAECVVGCAEGTQSYIDPSTGLDQCLNKVAPNVDGSCDSGFFPSGSFCVEFATVNFTPELCSPDYFIDNPPAVVVPDPELTETSGSFSVVSSSSSTDPDGTIRDLETVSTTSTDPDGSEEVKVVATETVTNPDLSSSVTITTNITGSTTGADGTASSAYGSSSVETSNYDADGVLTGSSESSSDYESEEGATAGSLVGKTAAAINFQPILNLKDELSGRFPISLVSTVGSIFSGFSASPVAPVWHLTFPNPFGSDVPFDIDLSPMQSMVAIIRTFLQYFILLCGFFLLYKRWT